MIEYTSLYLSDILFVLIANGILEVCLDVDHVFISMHEVA